MLWLTRPPLLRWEAALCLVCVAAWTEFSPRPTVEIPFLAVDVEAGERLTPDVIQFRTVPDPGFSPHRGDGFAATDLRAGDPLLPSMVATVAIPPGWMIVDAPLPGSPVPGSQAIAVVLSETPGRPATTFSAVIVSGPGAEPFGAALGTVALPPAYLAEAAAAVASGRLVVAVTSP